MIIASLAIMENGLFDMLTDDAQRTICGADEAGRGPLAGPVTAAAVVLPTDFPFEILNDSKKMTHKEREKAAIAIKEKAIAWAVTSLSHAVIDRVNILNASLEAMRLSLQKVMKRVDVDLFLVDGNKVPDVPIPCRAIVKGDSKVPEIMAASILAKTERDRIMMLCDRKWPQYGYASHKGYPTAEHRRIVLKLGPSPIERLSFHVSKDETPDLF